ncbi:MAG: phosphate transport system regulatory protein PhoU [Chloroflexi bacterium]|nr:MAG: phosphate transport system regulatory protein PhoU [Chloroflexota bacterium]
MELQQRAVLTQELTELHENILRMGSMVDAAIEKAMAALDNRDVIMAREVVVGDEAINQLRYRIEEDALRILATQQPIARDLRNVIASIHFAVELERIGDHAAGIARLVERLENEDAFDTLFKLPKMAQRARTMVQISVQAYVEENVELAHTVMSKDDKIDKQYRKLYRGALQQMQDIEYIRRATFLLWIGHNLERIGDRALNLAERVIFMATSEFVENLDDLDDIDDFLSAEDPPTQTA